MGLSLHTNYASLVTQNQLGRTNTMLSTAMERLGTGLRINSAADDAAGLQIANRLEAQTRGMGVAVRNSQDAISMMQTAEGALEELTNITFRMKDLAIQGANGVNGTAEYAALDGEYQELAAEFTRILTETTYGSGNALLAGGTFAAAIDFQIGASATEVLTVDLATQMTALSGVTHGAVGTQAGSTTEITALDAVLTSIGEMRSGLGANINRLEYTMNNLTSIIENTNTAKGRITDADFAVETSNMTKQQMLMQAGMSVLSQSNQMSGMIVSLLR